MIATRQRRLSVSTCALCCFAAILMSSSSVSGSSQQHSHSKHSSSHHELTYAIEEECDIGTTIGHLATDAGIERKYPANIVSQLRFKFLSPAPSFISVDETTGRLYVAGRIDRDALCRQDAEICRIQEDVAVQPVQYFNIIKVTVEIRDVNDHRPTFVPDQIVHEISESALTGSTSILLPTAKDPDSRPLSIKHYQLESNSYGDDDSQLFELKVSEKLDGSTEVRLVLLRSLDRERRDLHRVTVTAVDGGAPAALTGSLDVAIIVVDANDNTPTFESGGHYEVSLPENSPLATSVVRVRARDEDKDENGQLVFSFAPSTRVTYGHVFGIDNSTGEIYVTGNVDYEVTRVSHLIVVASDRGVPDARSSEATVVINIEDVNDNPPSVVVNTLYNSDTDVAHVTENSPPGTFVGHVIVSDPDKGSGGRFNCSLGTADDDESFRLRRISDGEFHVVTSSAAAPPDRELKKRYRTTIVCRDHGTPQLTAVKRLTVDVLDINDNTPRFSRYNYVVSVAENVRVGTAVLKANATDADEHSHIEYHISSNASSHFSIDPVTGVVTVAAPLDRETMPKYYFLLYAVDNIVPTITANANSISSSSLTATAKVVVHVTDVNDERPIFTQNGVYNFRVSELRPPGTDVGVVSAQDPDSPPNNVFRFEIVQPREERTGSNQRDVNSIENPWQYFALDPKTGRLTTTRMLDRERREIYRMWIEARDEKDPSLVSTATVTVVVEDVNDNSPIFLFPGPTNRTAEVAGPLRAGQRVLVLRAFDADAGANGRVTFSADNQQVIVADEDFSGYHDRPESINTGVFSVHSDTGEVFATVDVVVPPDLDNLTYIIPLVASDGGQPPLRVTSKLKIVVVRFLATVGAYPSLTQSRLHEFPTTGNSLTVSDDNVVILVAVCASTFVVVVALLAAIAVVGCQHRMTSLVGHFRHRQQPQQQQRLPEPYGGGTGNCRYQKREDFDHSLYVDGCKSTSVLQPYDPTMTLTRMSAGDRNGGVRMSETLATLPHGQNHDAERNSSIVVRLINEKWSSKLAPSV